MQHSGAEKSCCLSHPEPSQRKEDGLEASLREAFDCGGHHPSLCRPSPSWSRVSEAFTSRRIPRVAALRGSLEYLLCGALWEQLSTEPPNTLAQWGPLEQLFYGLSQNSCSMGSWYTYFLGSPGTVALGGSIFQQHHGGSNIRQGGCVADGELGHGHP